MSGHPFTPPEVHKSAFHCPRCNAYAKQLWGRAHANFTGLHFEEVGGVTFGWCTHCQQESIWVDTTLIHPAATQAPPPNSDLPETIREDYDEASSIVGHSPRGAAALLRLCIQKLCKHLGGSGKNINDDISLLVKQGLNPKIQKSLDIVRVIGNEAVHPGTIDLNDKPETAIALFHLINVIAEAMITQPKMIETLYGSLPEDKRDQISQRDKKSSN
ncbi:MAG: DUF4145 domain-containing protein [candidate division NC10 bacterium]|nr:DUF4145 domain-containing protein [candidate division NC10 bacterium]MDE2322387.1 DUF4145 domain-containing protein [candidate division NC10 bacterium]